MSSVEDILNALYRNPNLNKEDIMDFATQLQNFNIEIDEDLLDRFKLLDKHIREVADSVMIKKIPHPAKTYPLIHNVFNSLGISYPDNDRKHGAGMLSNGKPHIEIDDHPKLNQTSEIGIAGFGKFPDPFSDSIIVQKQNQYELKIVSGESMEFRIKSDGAWHSVISMSYTKDTWFQFGATYKANVGKKIYKNGSLEDSDSQTGSIDTTSNKVGLLGSVGGTNLAPKSSHLAWLSLFKKQVSDSWMADYNRGIVDMIAAPEITFIPFLETTDPKPNSTTGRFLTGTPSSFL